MKNKLFVLGVVIAIACIIVFLIGCSTANTTTASYNQSWGSFGEVLVPVKDFESKGMVFTTAQFIITDKGNISGKVLTYQDLLKAAQKVGADAIVNVTIDRIVENVIDDSNVFSPGSSIKETWYGSALAIKYTNTITQSNAPASTSRDRTFSGAASSPSSEQQSIIQKFK